MLDEPENSQQSQPASHVSSSPRYFWQNLSNFTQGVKKEAKIPSLNATENQATPETQALPEADGGINFQESDGGTDSQESDGEFDFDWGEATENGQPIDVEAELEAFLSRFLTEDNPTGETVEPPLEGTHNGNLAKLSQLSRRMNESLMAQVLEESQPEERGEIIRIAYESGVRKDDPLFAVMLAMNYYERSFDQKPAQLQQLFQRWSQAWKRHLIAAMGTFQAERHRLRSLIRTSEQLFQSSSQAALDQQSQSIADTVNLLVRQAAMDKVSWDIYALIRAGTLLLGAITIGGALGFVTALQVSRQPELDPSGPRQLTLEQAQAMTWGASELGRKAQANRDLVAWALSPEGQFARQFLQWNQALLSPSRGKRVCERDVERLGVTLTLHHKYGRVMLRFMTNIANFRIIHSSFDRVA